MRVLVCGSRSFTDRTTAWQVLFPLDRGTEIIHGGARGADQVAGEAAALLKLHTTVVPADWDTHGKRAGYLRNIQMLDMDPGLVIAFWDGQSKGTQHTINEARKRGIPVLVCSY
jgi:hypothetical protein